MTAENPERERVDPVGALTAAEVALAEEDYERALEATKAAASAIRRQRGERE